MAWKLFLWIDPAVAAWALDGVELLAIGLNGGGILGLTFGHRKPAPTLARPRVPLNVALSRSRHGLFGSDTTALGSDPIPTIDGATRRFSLQRLSWRRRHFSGHHGNKGLSVFALLCTVAAELPW